MKNYHPASWSKQAREMCDTQIEWVRRKYTTIEEVGQFFSNSYRAPLIRLRAAKRFGRLLRTKKSKFDT